MCIVYTSKATGGARQATSATSRSILETHGRRIHLPSIRHLDSTLGRWAISASLRRRSSSCTTNCATRARTTAGEGAGRGRLRPHGGRSTARGDAASLRTPRVRSGSTEGRRKATVAMEFVAWRNRAGAPGRPRRDIRGRRRQWKLWGRSAHGRRPVRPGYVGQVSGIRTLGALLIAFLGTGVLTITVEADWWRLKIVHVWGSGGVTSLDFWGCRSQRARCVAARPLLHCILEAVIGPDRPSRR